MSMQIIDPVRYLQEDDASGFGPNILDDQSAGSPARLRPTNVARLQHQSVAEQPHHQREFYTIPNITQTNDNNGYHPSTFSGTAESYFEQLTLREKRLFISTVVLAITTLIFFLATIVLAVKRSH